MMKEYNHKTINLPEITATTTNGVRLYETPEGNKYPSITTVLSVRNKKGLFEWRKRVGEEVANKISTGAARRGTRMHSLFEQYLRQEEEIVFESSESLLRALEISFPSLIRFSSILAIARFPSKNVLAIVSPIGGGMIRI